jgi:soluble lytic murein transglycosylase
MWKWFILFLVLAVNRTSTSFAIGLTTKSSAIVEMMDPVIPVDKTTEKTSDQDSSEKTKEIPTFSPLSGITEVTLFQKGLEKLKLKSYENATELFSQALLYPPILRDYVYFYRAQAYMAIKKWKEAERDLQEISAPDSHFKLVLDSRLMLADVLFELKQPGEVKALFSKLLRRVKVTEDEPKVLYMLAKSEKLSGSGKGCKYLLQLYKKFPAFEPVKDWNADLNSNKFLGDQTQCPFEVDDFQDRMRALLWAGLDKKAYSEMIMVSERIKESQPVLSSVLRSQYELQEGDTAKAYNLLKPNLGAGIKSPEFLLNFAATASRAGDNLIGSGAYWYVARNFPRTKEGQRGLFLAAIMSYQFQDYDGAEFRFKEFARLYPRNSLSKEVGWHLAWLDYLRGHYDSSISRLKDLIKKNRRKSGVITRYQYWLAMNYLRIKEMDKAHSLFLNLSQDSLRNYYSLAAQSRLEDFPVKTKPSYSALRLRLAGSQYLIPYMGADVMEVEPVDEEESETSFVLAEEEREQLEDQTDPVLADEESKLENQEVTEFKSPKLQRRFERAQILFSLGLIEWAKWEDYEVEKKTRNKDYLKTLLQDYQKLEQFHRASQIAHLSFISERSKGEYGARALWEAAYPKAYKSLVEKWARKENIPEELSWAIMKQESQFKKEAISPVGALGLMQVMPMTGYKMSHLRGDRDFSPTELLTPQKAIEVGSAYLSRLSKKMKDNYGLVAASYNAGPHRVDIWTKSFGHLDADEFIEHIPFAETRNYVKKVLTNMQIYRELYTGRKDLVTKLNKKFDYEIVGALSLSEDWEPL